MSALQASSLWSGECRAPPNLKYSLVGREFVAVEDDLGLAAVARHAAEHFVLAALAEFAEIGVRAIGRGHAGIVFLDPPAHFLDQRLLQGPGMAEQAFGIGVLRLEIFADIRVEDRRVAQHLLPVVVLQPGIVVGHGDAVQGKRMRPARRDRRRRELLCAGILSRGSSFGRAAGFVGLYRVECTDCQMELSATKRESALVLRMRPLRRARGPGNDSRRAITLLAMRSSISRCARDAVGAPNIGIWLTASTTAKVMTSIEMPSTEIAARSPLSLRS